MAGRKDSNNGFASSLNIEWQLEYMQKSKEKPALNLARILEEVTVVLGPPTASTALIEVSCLNTKWKQTITIVYLKLGSDSLTSGPIHPLDSSSEAAIEKFATTKKLPERWSADLSSRSSIKLATQVKNCWTIWFFLHTSKLHIWSWLFNTMKYYLKTNQGH